MRNITKGKRRAARRGIHLVLLAVFIFFPWDVAGISTAPPNSQEKDQERTNYYVSVNAITLAVTVQDKRGKYIETLFKEDFSVYENNVRQEITYFKYDTNAPVSLAVLLDVSGSMALQDKMEDAKRALRELVSTVLNPRDEIALLIFADSAVEIAAPFSADKTAFLSVLGKTEAYGQTALNDAVAVSPAFADRGAFEKRALLLITDGVENRSQYSPEQAAEIARKVDIPIYTIGYRIPLSEQLLKKHKRAPSLTATGIVDSLEKFSRATGGKAFFLNEPGELSAAFQEIKKELGHQYIIGYTSHTNLESKYRKIRVATKDKKLRVRTREGYEVPASRGQSGVEVSVPKYKDLTSGRFCIMIGSVPLSDLRAASGG